MRTTWLTPDLSTDERELVLTAICARHLKHAVPSLLEALGDAVPAVRVIAARNLGETLSAQAEQPLLELLATEKNVMVLEAAVQSLGVLGSEKALPAIRQLSRLPALIRACAFAGARIGGSEGEEFLSALRVEHPGDDPVDTRVRDLVDFLRSASFARQEKVLDKVRRQRLR